MPGKITYLIGPTRAGKSTFCKKWLQERDIEGYHRIVVNADMIRIAIHGERYNHHSEPIVFSAQYLMLKTFYLQGYHVLFDETNTTDISIRRILEIDPEAMPLIFDTPAEICKERAVASSQLDLDSVIDRHCNQLKRLLEEGIDNVHKRLLRDISISEGS